MTDFQHFAIRNDDGRVFYHLADTIKLRGKTTTVDADGTPMTLLTKAGGWWAADHVAETITATHEQYPRTIAWRLSDPANVSVPFPVELTPDELRSTQERYGDVVYDLYERIEEKREPITETISTRSWTVLDGNPPDFTPGRPWVPSLPKALVNHPQYHRYFPGHITGLYSEVQTRAKAMRHVTYAFDASNGQPQGLYITIEVPFQTARTRWKPAHGARGQELSRSGRKVPDLARRDLYLPVPHRVPGATYAEADAAYSEQLAFWLGVLEAAGAKACDACNGTGHVPDGSEEYERPRR
jgi:hypothetical protein